MKTKDIVYRQVVLDVLENSDTEKKVDDIYEEMYKAGIHIDKKAIGSALYGLKSAKKVDCVKRDDGRGKHWFLLDGEFSDTDTENKSEAINRNNIKRTDYDNL